MKVWTPPANSEARRRTVGTETSQTTAEQIFDEALRDDPDRARLSADQLRGELAARGIRFGGAILPSSIKPHFIGRANCERWTAVLGDLLVVLEAAAERLRLDLAFRRNGPFGPAAWALLDVDPGYCRRAVVCRPDVVWHGRHISVLEVNADSPAMMLYADAVQAVQRRLFPLREIEPRCDLTFVERVPALLDALLATYREWGGREASPVIAIVDWPGQKTTCEQEHLARAFTELGCPSFLCHPHELEVRGGVLRGRGQRIDIVQRRVLFHEIVARQAELGAFLTAYHDRLACVINPLSSYLVGCKASLAELHRAARSAQLGDEDRRVVASVVPTTLMVDEMDDAELAERDRWVLKPVFGSGGAGVAIGAFADRHAWTAAVRAARGGAWVAQAYQPIPRYRVPLSTANHVDAADLYANWNPFFFNGAPGGGIARVSTDPIVGISARGALLPTIVAD